VLKYVLPATLVANALLVLMCIAGAFAGARRASMLFNSGPMAVYFVSLVVLLAASLAAARLRRDWALTVMHLGLAVVLLGGMWGSHKAHELREAWLDDDRIHSGVMQLFLDRPADEVFDTRTGRFKSHLPFEMRLDDFRIDYYGQAGPPGLYLQVGEDKPSPVEWAQGQPSSVGPFRITVLEYLPKASARLEPQGGVLHITAPSGAHADIPARQGEQVSLGEGPTTVRVVQVYSNLVVREVDGKPAAVDVPGSHGPPALAVEVAQPGGDVQTAYVMYGYEGHHGPVGVEMIYDIPVSAVPDEEGKLTAMKVRVEGAGLDAEHWLVGRDFAGVPLDAVGPPSQSAPATSEAHARQAALYMAQTPRMPRQFHARLTALRNGREVRSESISVNHPMHFGGYHFYQTDWDKEGEQYTVVTLASDAGLGAVAAGAAMLLAGVFGGLWVRPAWRYLSRRRT
jgi:hypothetical protein